ncbi:MAG: histidine ammonia-lyase, partial [Actinomycetota bacterium]
LNFRSPLSPTGATPAFAPLLRREVEGPGPDRYLAPEIAATTALVRDGSVVRAVETVTGPLNTLEN